MEVVMLPLWMQVVVLLAACVWLALHRAPMWAYGLAVLIFALAPWHR